VAQGRLQAYFDSDVVLASSPGLDPEPLRAALPRGEGMRVSAIEGVGLVAARRIEDFTHVAVVGAGELAIELTGWQENPGEFAELESRPVDLAFLADAPRGVAARLLDAALTGPVVLAAAEPEPWLAWLSCALPRLTWSTAGDPDVHVRVADEPGAIDVTEPSDAAPSLYASVALELAARGELRAAAARLHEPDGVALAVHGGATELIAPHQLPLALQRITELATAGHVREAARAARALPSGGVHTQLVVHEPAPLPELVEAEVEEITDAEVVEPEPLPDDVVISVPFDVETLAQADAWANLLAELETGMPPDDEAEEAAPVEPEVVEEEVGMTLAELEDALKRERE